jgi:hypothetical protein
MLRASNAALEQYILGSRYEGYDPFDALKSAFFRFPVLRNTKLLRFAAQQILRRVPVNLRPLLLIPAGRNPVTFGLCLQGFTTMALAFPREKERYYQEAHNCLDEIEALQSRGYSGACWGYDFDWEGRYVRIPAFTPTVVATGFISNAIFKHYQATGEKRCLDLCQGAARFVMNDLHKTRLDDTFCYSYSPFDKQMVLNATMKGARLLTQVYSVTREPALKEEARATVRFVMRHQRESGAWPYSTGDARHWADNFHTGYVLECLDDYMKFSGDREFETSLGRGWQYYLDHFFEESQVPKYYDDSAYPVDSTAAAESIFTLCRFDRADIALRVGKWMIREMQDPSGFFYYQKHRHYVNKISYMRWSNAWMFAALAALLSNLQHEGLSELPDAVHAERH